MEYMENCIHLKACRRLQKKWNKTGRGCNEFCTAYEEKEKEPIDPYGWDWGYFGY